MHYKPWTHAIMLLLLCSSFSAKGFVLIISLYNEKNPHRIGEFVTCLETNLQHPLIEHIHVLHDTAKDEGTCILINYLKSRPITLTTITGRPSFGQCFELANSVYPDKNIIISNADIYFNDTLNALQEVNFDNLFVALTRWEVQKDFTLKVRGDHLGISDDISQDTWIFKTPIQKFEYDHFLLGTIACDAGIAAQAARVGMKIINPCYTVQGCHLHLSEIHTWEEYNHYQDMPMACTTGSTLDQALKSSDPMTYWVKVEPNSKWHRI